MVPRVASALWSLKWRLLCGGVLGLLLAAGAQAWYICLGGNFHTVIAGRVFRGAQPSPDELAALGHRHGIRTVVNLRGYNAEYAWYREEVEAAHRIGVHFVDVGIPGYFPASEDALRRLIDVILTAEYPIHLHCHSGADRSGLAAAIAILLLTDGSLAEARGQLALRFGHFPGGKARVHDRLLDQYEGWLQAQGLEHRPAHLRRWAHEAYRAADCAP